MSPEAEFGAHYDGSIQDGVDFPPNADFRAPNDVQQAKISEAARLASARSMTARSLQTEFANRGGGYLIDYRPDADYQSAAFRDQFGRPGVVLTREVIDHAPWEFIQAAVARAQSINNRWCDDVPPSAEKLTAAMIQSLTAFGELSGSTSRSQGWATDKDHQARDGRYVMWTWYEQALAYARSSAHLVDSQFFTWSRDFLSKLVSRKSAYQYSLWEMLTGAYSRPGTALHEQALPADAPRIDEATYNRGSQKIYGVNGRGKPAPGHEDETSAVSWFLSWLKQRNEI